MKTNNLLAAIFFFTFSPTVLAGQPDYEWLLENERFADIICVSLFGVASPECQLDCQSKHLRNAGRASLSMGDYKGANLFLQRSLTQQPSPVTIGLLTYVAILQRNEPAVKNYLKVLTPPDARERMRIADTIEGPAPYSRESLVAIKTAATTTTDASLRDALSAFQRHEYKSPHLAGGLALIPGMGFGYLGMWQSAATSLFLTGIGAWATADLLSKDMPGAAGAAAAMTSVFYIGGILSSVKSAHDYNIKISHSSRKTIRGIVLPELRFEW